MNRIIVMKIAVVSIGAGLIAFGIDDFLSLIKKYPMFAGDIFTLVCFGFIGLFITGICLWSIYLDSKELEFFKEEQHKEEIRQRMLNKPMPPGIYEN